MFAVASYLLPSLTLELETTEDELFAEELLATLDEDFAELEHAIPLLDSSLDELRMTLEEELLLADELEATDEELFAEELLATLDEDLAELDEVALLLDSSTSLGVTLESELPLQATNTDIAAIIATHRTALEKKFFINAPNIFPREVKKNVNYWLQNFRQQP